MIDTVSVVMPAFNAERHIEKSIMSVLNQTYKNWELIIVNDCSVDNTIKLVNNLSKNNHKIRVVDLKKNSGVSNARNEGIKIATGRFIAFLDSDDLWNNRKLEKQVELIKKEKRTICCTSYGLINELDIPLNKAVILKNSVISYKSQLNGSKIACSSVLIDRSKYPNLKFENIGHEDYMLWLNILKDTGPASSCDEILTYYRVGEQSLSSNKFTAIKWQYKIIKEINNKNMVKTFYNMTKYAINGFVKYVKCKFVINE